MKHSMTILLALLVCISWVCDAAPRIGGGRGYGGMGDPLQPTPQSDYWVVWRGFRSSTDSLLKTIGATNAEAALLLTQIQTNIAFLDGKWNVWLKQHNQPGQYSSADDYLKALRTDDRLLSSLMKEKDTQKALNTLRDVALDVQIKADNCRNSKDGLGKEIGVTVHTRAGEKEIGGYEVFYVSKGMFDVKSAHDRFPRQSSPTDEKILPPGGYAMWVRKKSFTSDPITLRIGGRGETHLEVDIVVPPE
jgi:hypothetical protein